MKLLNKQTSDALDAMFQGLPENVVEAARELFVANNEHELKLSAKAFQIVARTELRKYQAKGIRKAVNIALLLIDHGADPAEGVCIIEDYATELESITPSNVVHITQWGRHG